MKKLLLFFAFVFTQLAIAQLPNPVYAHNFTETLTASNFTVGTGISLSDRDGFVNHAAYLASGHGALSLNISTNKTALMQEGTVSLWFKYEGEGISGFGDNKPLVFWSNGNTSYSEGIMFALGSSGNIRVISYKEQYVGGNQVSSETTGANGQWHHFAVTWKFGSNGYVKGYLNGALVVTKSIEHNLTAALDTMYFTGFNDTYSSSLYGSIDEIKVFTQALTASQVLESMTVPAQTCQVTFTDNVLKNVLLNHNPTIDTNNNGEIECSEAAAFTDFLNLYNYGISNLEGIEAFTNVTYINCSRNSLTQVNFGLNPNLTRIDCNRNNLTSLDLSNNLALTQLYCGENPFTFVDITANTAIHDFHATGSPNLVAVNLANGNNANFTQMMIAGCPNLTCIQVDSISSVAGWTGFNFNKPTGVSYSTTCALSTSDFDTAKISVYPNPVQNILNIETEANVTIFDLSGRQIMKTDNTNQINVSSLAKGTYILQLEVDGNINIEKIIKQ